MSEFSVHPSALDRFADVIGSANGGSTLDAKYLIDYGNYVEEHLHLDGPGLVFGWIKPRVEEIRQRLSTDSTTISTHLIESAMGLTASASDYRRTDAAQASRLDSVYKPTGVTAADDGYQAGGTTTDPATALTPPSEEGGMPSLVQELLDAGGVFSVSDLVIKILRWCGLDIMGWVTDHLAGSPSELAKVKSALENLASFDQDAATVVGDGAATMFGSWTGNAADAAHGYFDKTASALTDHGTAISGVATKMQALIIGIQEGMAALEGALTIAIDAAIKAAVAVAAAGCLAEVPGIDVLAAIVGAAEVANVVGKVRKFFDIWNVVWASHEGILGLITGLVGTLQGYDVSSSLPTSGYYNASQGSAPSYGGNDVPARPGRPR